MKLWKNLTKKWIECIMGNNSYMIKLMEGRLPGGNGRGRSEKQFMKQIVQDVGVKNYSGGICRILQVATHQPENCGVEKKKMTTMGSDDVSEIEIYIHQQMNSSYEITQYHVAVLKLIAVMLRTLI